MTGAKEQFAEALTRLVSDFMARGLTPDDVAAALLHDAAVLLHDVAADLSAPETCRCFGDIGLHASTHIPFGSRLPHCDLCGLPVKWGSTDVLSLTRPEP